MDAGRRWFVTRLPLAVVVAPHVAEAQQAAKVPRIGWLTSSVVHTNNVDAFLEGMRALGYREVKLETRAAANQTDRLPALTAELLALNVDVIVTDGGAAVAAAKRATATVPIVIGATAADLVRDGIVASLARPGGNVTGFTITTGPELYGKRVGLLREALPTVSRLAILWNPSNEVGQRSRELIATTAKALGLRPEFIDARQAGLDAALSAASRPGGTALITVTDAFLWSQRTRIVSLATKHRLPGMYSELEFVEEGGLMAYGPNVRDNFRRAAGYVAKILAGTKPGDLPVEQPTKFELVINLKTAKALGLTIPQSVLLRADQTIE